MLRHGSLLLALGVAGFCAIVIYNATMTRVWKPVSEPLELSHATMRTGSFTLEPANLYGITLSVDPVRAVPYADCLLGAGRGGIDGDCQGHVSALDLLWIVRSDRGGAVASGKYPHEGAMFGYTGKRVDVTIAYFSVRRKTNAFLQLHYRRSAAALGSLNPYLEVSAPDALESVSTGEAMLALLLIAIGGLGAVMLLFSISSRHLPIRRPGH